MTTSPNGQISYDHDMKIDAKTWNPFTGCTKVSPGCKHCYAETMAKKLQKNGERQAMRSAFISLFSTRGWIGPNH